MIFFAGEVSYIVSKVADKAIGEEAKDKSIYSPKLF